MDFRTLYKRPALQADARGSARHVENGVGVVGILGKRLHGLVGRQNQQIDFSAARFTFHLVHHRKRSISSGADYEASALPGHLLLNRDRSVPELLAEFLGGLLLALANLAAVDDHVIFEGDTVDFDRTEVKFAEVHGGASN